MKVRAALNLVVPWLFLLSGCDRTRSPSPGAASAKVVVGSKNFTEEELIAEIVAQHIEHHLKVQVGRRLGLGTTDQLHDAIVEGQIDIYPEYTGTAFCEILKRCEIPNRSRVLSLTTSDVFNAVQADYKSNWSIKWFAPLGFNDPFTLAVRTEDPQVVHIKTLTEATNRSDGWVIGSGPEFVNRPDGLPGLLDFYPLKLNAQPKTYKLVNLYKVLEEGEVDMVASNATDGFLLDSHDVKILIDDKHFFLPYQAAIIARSESLSRIEGLESLLNQLSGQITDKEMQKMNNDVDVKHRSVAAVASEFLMKHSL